MPIASSRYAVSGIQLTKPMKSVTSLLLKKQVTAIVCVFYEMLRLKTPKIKLWTQKFAVKFKDAR